MIRAFDIAATIILLSLLGIRFGAGDPMEAIDVVTTCASIYFLWSAFFVGANQ